MRRIAPKLIMGFQQQLAHLSPCWLLTKATSLSQHLAEHGFKTRYKSKTTWKTSWGVCNWKSHDNSTTSKITYVDIEAFLAKEWSSVYPSWKKLDFLHLKDFLKCKCRLYLKQPLTPPQRRNIVAYRTLNHRLCH